MLAEPEEIGSSRFILAGLATLTGFLQVYPGCAGRTLTGSSRLILCGLANELILCGLATLTGSSRLILLGLGNQKKLVPPGTLFLVGLATLTGFLQIEQFCSRRTVAEQ